MPQRNGTGPQGLGSATGRRLGNCVPKAEENISADKNQGSLPLIAGRGLGLRMGRGSRRGSGRNQNRG